MRSQQRLGLVGRLARRCFAHRRRTIVAWIVVLVAVSGAASAVGSHTANDFSLNGTESQDAQDVLTRDFSAQAGDVD